jgi:dienelactone hydrolase
MNNIDVILLVGLIAVASCLIIIPKRISRILKPLIALIILLVFTQLLIEGYYWHYVPSYLLLLLLIIRTHFANRLSNNLQKRLLQSIFVFLILASIIPWAIFLPIPKLLEPQGDYKVGTRIFRWLDMDRAELITSDIHDKRNVVVQAWYPTEENANAPHSYYLDGIGNLPEKIGIIPGWIFNHYDQVNTHGILNAPISKTQNQWPVIIFLTGNGASRAFYTSLVGGLASHGYVVLAIDHPYEAMITQLADGKIATTIEEHLNDDPDLYKFMKGRLDLRIADVKFVLNQLDGKVASSDCFFSSLDKNRIVIAGHSLGGASAAVAMAVDSRIKAAANIDGTLYGELPELNCAGHFLLIESKKDRSDRFLRYENGNQQFFKHFGGGYRYEILEADHYSFTDAPLLLGFPARFLAAHFLEFGNIPAKTNTATVEILDTFFFGVLNYNLTHLDSVVSRRYQGIIQKPID